MVYDAMNKGLSLASGDYIEFLGQMIINFLQCYYDTDITFQFVDIVLRDLQ